MGTGERRRPGTGSKPPFPTYYGTPVIHKPHWKWLIIVYFFFGGIAGASAVIAAISDLVGPAQDQRVGRVARYVSFAALLPSPVLLILDLGRPERFINMLRIVKFRSPMSVGTWGLTLFGLVSGLRMARQVADDGLIGGGRAARLAGRVPRRATDVGTIPLGFFVAGYTGVLLAATAVPLWAKRALFLGPLFLASAFSTATAAIVAALHLLPGTSATAVRRLERLQAVAMVAELALHAAWTERLGETARPLTRGRTGALLHYGTLGAGLAVPLCLQPARTVLPGGWRRPLGLAGSLLVLNGGFILRYAIVVAGRASADDPGATFAWARRGAASPAGPPVADDSALATRSAP
jgi:formate-dependent nitrite reductase membrane component NrfD